MSILPNGTSELIDFCEVHVPVWQAAPTTIGLTAPQVADLATATVNARMSFVAAQAARDASKAATVTQNSNAKDMRLIAADLVRQIKAFAEAQPSPNAVYAAAQISPPSPPSPMPAPGKPVDFAINLEPDGSVTLTWNADNAAASGGAFFTVARKLPGQSTFTGIGGTSGSTTESRRMRFTDSTVPASAASAGAQYIVQGFRGTRAGTPSDTLLVQFGLDGGSGQQVATLRMAA